MLGKKKWKKKKQKKTGEPEDGDVQQVTTRCLQVI